MIVSSHVHTDATQHSTALTSSSMTAQPSSARLHSSPMDTIAFGHQENDSTTKPIEPKAEKKYTWKERVASRFKLKKLSLDPRRLEGALILSIGLGLIAGMASFGLGFALTIPLFAAGLLLSFLTGAFFSKKPVDIEDTPVTLPADQQEFKNAFEPITQNLGALYSTLGQVGLYYNNEFKHLKHAGDILKQLDLGTNSEELKDKTADVLTYLTSKPEQHQSAFHLDKTKSAQPKSRIEQALTIASKILTGKLLISETSALPITKLKSLTEQSKASLRYSELKAHQDQLILLVSAFHQIHPEKLTEELKTFTADMPKILSTGIAEVEEMNTLTQTYGQFITDNQTLLKKVHKGLTHYTRSQPKAFLDKASQWFSYSQNQSQTITAETKETDAD